MFWRRILMLITNNIKRMAVSILILSMFFSVANVFANDQGSVKNDQYIIVSVHSGDTVWSIASRYTNNKSDIRDFIYTIRKINSLDKNAEIYPGQVLKIPIQS